MAYLYNGNRCPDICSVYTPELQKEFPFAIMSYRDASFLTQGLYIGDLFLLSDQVYYDWAINGGGPYFGSGTLQRFQFVTMYDDVVASGSSMFGIKVTEANKWVYVETKEFDELSWSIKWSNYDILKNDGSVHMKASDPSPVYE